ncbi:PLP-dependent aminotransferase family protein [Rhizobium halophytocola]|uniref:GntR family transcriptional regulator/MocR family aminotransferase n=1 Tax=Rhizobium halophytocola TaxID=735519 RepID=A0ABS4DT40_9HYPH|nr:PLP-dependent aminotransferase family protein [Rhizobium halophytocola]MBP1848779.1 GntR family transcriptional regulator/MocR family aminotransferase [Rhizobium halophytocola]
MNFQRIMAPRAHPDIVWQRLFAELDRDGQGLSIQIRRTIVYGIETGTLTERTRLPPSRQLASLLGVARNTVTAAYQLLIDEGFLVSRERSGIFVASGRPHSLPSLETVKTSADEWTPAFAVRPSALRQIDKPRDWFDYPYPFLFGQFDPGIFPTNNWREAIRATSSVKEINGWAGDQIDDDDPDLVEQLRVQVLPKRGIFADPGEVIVTIGSQQALSMLVQLFVGRQTAVGIENPGYPDMRNMVRLATDDTRLLSMDRHGVLPDPVFSRCDIAFLTVGHQCPTTAVMPLDRRRALLAAADRDKVILVEDDYEADLMLDGEPETPCLKSLDETGRVIYVGSFSKALAPGLRIGYIVAPRPVIDELRVLRRMLLRHPPTNNQRVLATFIALGHYRLHLQQTGAILRRRAQMIVDRLPLLLPTCRWRRDPGGKSFWIEGPAGLDSRQLVHSARERGVLIEAGDIFFDDPEAGLRTFRLGFTAIADRRIEQGLTLLGELIPGHG